MEKRSRLLTSILQVAFYLNFLKAYSEGSIQDNYIGCYYNNMNDQPGLKKITLQNNTTLTIELCIGHCLQRNSTYAKLQNSKECLCWNSFGVMLPDTFCNSLCPGNQSEYCGGSKGQRAFYSLYAVCDIGYYGRMCEQVCHCKRQAPCDRMTGKCPKGCEGKWFGTTCSNIQLSEKYIGCFQDNETRAIQDKPRPDRRMTVEMCSNSCILRKKSIAGLQAGSYCSCGENYAKYGPLKESVCKDSCVGNQSQKCGGPWANSVYSVCPAGYYGPKCHHQCHCYNNSRCVYLTGECNSTCKSGWTGNSCSVRECLGDCSLNETCATVDLKFATITRCRCLPGYSRNAFLDISLCQDIDECVLGLYDASTTTNCTNTVGSYKCTCKPGYKQYNETTCYASNAGTVAGAVVGSILGLALIVGIVLLVLYLYRRRRPEKLANQLEELPNSSQEMLLRDQTLALYGDDPNVYEEIGPATGNALNTLHNKLSDPDSINQEFESVAMQPKDFCALGKMPKVKKKNRFINIIPYESNRVVLSIKSGDLTSQYINASYIQGYNYATKFIATQGPRAETLEDFWRMIIENRVHLIVMITHLVENQKNKCEKYWPERGQPVVYGDITVILCSEDSWPDYTVRCIRCSKKSETVELQQLHYLSWPDHDVPSDTKGFLTFRRMVHQRMKPDKYTVVHCSAGAGRTGAFIAIDYLLEQEKVEHDVRILDCLKKLRDQRSQMIQNLAQYLFVHNTLLLAFEIGDTVIPTAQFLSKYKQFQTTDPTAGLSVLEKQFQFLEQVNMDPIETAKYRVRSKVVAKNKMNEMNAVFVQSWKLKAAYIATQPADPFANIWELQREHSCSVIIYFDPAQGSEDSFFPTKGYPKTMSDCTLLCESMTKEDYGTRYTVIELKELEDTTYANVGSSDIYQNTVSISSKTQVTVLHATEFSGKGSWDFNRLMSLYNVVSQLTSKKNGVPVMVVSSDCSLSGFCLAAFNAFEMMKREEMIDIYQIVLNIRKSKPELFSSMSSYIDLHNVVERYILTSTA